MADNVVKDRQRWSSAPYFIVDDVVSTADYYRDKLGFHYERFWNDPPSFCMVKRNGVVIMLAQLETAGAMRPNHVVDPEGDRKSTRLNSSHGYISYAVFCLKKKKQTVMH